MFDRYTIEPLHLARMVTYIVLFSDPRQYGHASGNAPPWPPAGSSGAIDTCNRSHRATVPQHRRLARLRARMTSSLGQTVQRFFERQLAPPAALRQSCSDEFERSMSRWLPPNKCDCRKRPTIHLTPRLHRDVCFFFSPRREFRPARDGCWELLGTPYAPKEEEFPYLCRVKKCAAHQARQDGATAIMTRRRHYAARSLGVSALSIERRCRSVVWHRKKVRFRHFYGHPKNCYRV